jgi:predicted alpha/beta-hydrolase family hydrolase
MGGRICSLIAAGADGQPPPRSVAALVAISYPLHPPGKPDRLRIEHLPDIAVPCLFVAGDRDPFGTPDELASHAAVIAGPVTHVTVSGTHELRSNDGEVVEAVRTWLAGLRGEAGAPPGT